MYLLLFEAQLLGIGQVLPLAAAAYAEMFAERFLAHRGAAYETYGRTFHETAAVVAYLYIDNVTRYGKRYEYHYVVVFAHGLAFSGQRCYFEPFN